MQEITGENWPEEVIEALRTHQFSSSFCSDILKKAEQGKDFEELTGNQRKACWNWVRK